MTVTGIIILNFNSSSDTVKCIDSIVGHNSAPVKLIVVDNGSPDKQEVEKLDAYFSSTFGDQYRQIPEDAPARPLSPVTFITSPTNSGYAGGNNKGLKFAFADDEIEDVIILNNDILFRSDIIPVLYEVRQQVDKPAILTPLLIAPDGTVEHNCARSEPSNWSVMLPFLLFKKDIRHILTRQSSSQKILKQSPQLKESPFFEIGLPSGSFMYVRKGLLQEMGGFDEGTFLYYEENILCKKLKKQGYRNYCVPSVKAVHIGGASTGKTANLFLQKCSLESADYYMSRFSGASFPEMVLWKAIVALWKLKFFIKEHA